MAKSKSLVVFGTLSLAATLFASEGIYDDEVVQAFSDCVEQAMAGPEIDAVPPACLSAAEAGVPGAQYLMGEILYSLDSEANIGEAAIWFKKAAANGHPGAIFNIGLLQVQGLGVEENREEGLKNVDTAICSGYPPAVSFAEEVERTVTCTEDDANRVSKGVWEGELEPISVPSLESVLGSSLRYRIEFAESGPRVYRVSDEQEWIEVKPGSFRGTDLGPSCIVSSIDDGWDLDGRWVETWTFTLTSNPDETATAVWVRQVNNVQVPRNHPHATFTIIAKGVMSRHAADR